MSVFITIVTIAKALGMKGRLVSKILTKILRNLKRQKNG
jgi:hypothetical protein